MAKTSSSPTAKRAQKPYSLLNKKAPKQHAPPVRVANDRSCQKDLKIFMKESNGVSMRILGLFHGDHKISQYAWPKSSLNYPITA